MTDITMKDLYYTAVGIGAAVGYILLFTVFSWFGWVGWILNFLMMVGLGAILGDFIQTWHIDFKFRAELDSFEDALKDALKLKKAQGNDPTT